MTWLCELDDDMEDSGYAQRLAMIEDLSLFFEDIEYVRYEIRNMNNEVIYFL